MTFTDAHVVVPKHYAQGSSFVILYFVQALTDFTHILLDYFTVTGAIIAPVTVKQPWRIWVIYIYWCYNHNEAKQNKNTAYFMRYAIYIIWPRKINDWLNHELMSYGLIIAYTNHTLWLYDLISRVLNSHHQYTINTFCLYEWIPPFLNSDHLSRRTKWHYGFIIWFRPMLFN